MKIDHKNLRIEIKSGEKLPKELLPLIKKLEVIFEEARERMARGIPSGIKFL